MRPKIETLQQRQKRELTAIKALSPEEKKTLREKLEQQLFGLGQSGS